MSTFAMRALPLCLGRTGLDDRTEALAAMDALRARRLNPNGNDFDQALRDVRFRQAGQVHEIARTLYLPTVKPPNLRQVAHNVAALAHSMSAMPDAPMDDVADVLDAARKVVRLGWNQQA